MRRLLPWVLALSSALAAPAMAQACDNPSESTGATNAGTAGVLGSPSVLTTQTPVVLVVARGQSEDYVRPGSTSFTVTGPSGTVTKPADQVAGNPESRLTLGLLPAGHYRFSVTWQVRTCDTPNGSLYELGDAGPVEFNVVAPGQRPTVAWNGHPGSGGIAKGSSGKTQAASISGVIRCGDEQQASPDPITFSVHYELGTKLPSESSPGKSSTYRCPITSKHAATLFKKSWGSLGFDVYGGGFSLFEGHTARVLMVVRSGGVAVAAIRVRIKPKAGSLTMVPDAGPCPVTCARRWTAR